MDVHNAHTAQFAIVIQAPGSQSAMVASLSPDDLAELIAINRRMVVGGVGVFTRELPRLEALIQKVSTVMPAETPVSA